MQMNIELNAILHIAPSMLHLFYTARNLTPEPIFLFNILHGEFDGASFPIESSPYVAIVNGIVVISKKLIPVPDHMLVEKPNIPFLTRVPSGGRHEETMSAVLPLVPRDPYSGDEIPARIVKKKPAVFELGYFVGATGTEAQGHIFPTTHGPLPGFDVFDPSAQLLVRTDVLDQLPFCADE
jgi:hypothetical protein